MLSYFQHSADYYYECSEPGGARVLPNQIIWIGNNSALACMNQCAAFGYPASGTEVRYCVVVFTPSDAICLVWSRMLYVVYR
jgi:hypothetical protein